MALNKRLADQMQRGLKQYAPILRAQRDRDVSEADTVTIVKDILSDVLGYDKYAELTGEHAIRGTYCDLAVQFDEKVQLLIEVKAIGAHLQERHVKQAIDYASNLGVDWVALTNGVEWVLYRVLFRKPIDKEEILRLNLLEVNPRNTKDLETLYLLTRKGLTKDALTEFHRRQDAMNRYLLAAVLLHSDTVLNTIRREVRRATEVFVSPSDIANVLRDQVLKRETLEGEQAESAERQVNRRAVRRIPKAHKADVTEQSCADGAGGAEAA